MAFTGLSWKDVFTTFSGVDKAVFSLVGKMTNDKNKEDDSASVSSGDDIVIATGVENKLVVLKRKSSNESGDDGETSSKRMSIEKDDDDEDSPSAMSDTEDAGAMRFLTSLTNVIIKPSQVFKKEVPTYPGVDSWVPADREQISEIPKDLWDQYKKVHPNVEGPKKYKLQNGEFSVLVSAEKLSRESSSRKVCGMDKEKTREEKLTNSDLNKSGNEAEKEEEKKDKKENTPEELAKKPLHHLAITLYNEKNEKYVMSLYRSHRVEEVVALCERCRENPELFRVFPADVDIKDYINLIFNELRENMTWKSIHLSSKIGLVEFFKNVKQHKLQKKFQMIAQPEGLSPLMIAIQNNQLETVKLMLELGADVNFLSATGSNALHIAATTSEDMIKLLWETKQCANMLNKSDSAGNSPLYIALTAGYITNARLLSSLGAAITAADATHEATPLIGTVKRGKLNEATLKKIVEMKSDALNEEEATTGNSVVHCAPNKKTLIMLLELYKGKADPNAKNLLKQTPLHVYVMKEYIPMIMTICTYGIDIDAQDCNGNTPLHVAVARGNVDVTRQLLCLGANPNIVNNYKESPRHVAARNTDHQKALDLVRSLIICGAKTCETGFVGCAFGCMHREGLGACRAQMGTEEPDTEDKVNDVHVSSQAATAAYEFELDPETHVVNEAYAEKNETRSYPHEQALLRVKERLKELVEKKKKSNVVNVLTLDGGGIRGLVTVQMLLALEKLLDKPIVEYFDWIGATSTGCYIMSAILCGNSLRQAQQYYLQFKDQLFDSWSRPYDTVLLESFMKRTFGEDRRLSEISYPKFFYTTVRADTFPVQLDLCRNYRLPLKPEENDELGFGDPAELTLWKACRRSSAAPTYFSASEGKYIDGGMIANNPTLDLLSEIGFWNTTCQRMKKLDKMVDVGCVLSVGTGITPICPVDPSVFEMNDWMGLLRGIRNLSLVVIDQATATEGAPITRSRSWCHSLGYPYYRLNAPLFKDIILDTNDDSELAKVMWDSVVYAHTHRKDFQEVAELLKLVGTNEERKKNLTL